MRIHWITRFVAVAAVIALSVDPIMAAESAESYPSKTVRVLVGMTPGGGVDITARLIANNLSKQFKQSVIVENRSGAQGDIASEVVAKAPPDGYTLYVVSPTFAVNAATVKGQKFDSLKDFQPITMLADNPNLVMVNPSVPAKTVKELIAYAKANPGKLNIGYTGSIQELFGNEFAKQAGIEAGHIPYKGAGNMQTALLSNEIQIAFFSTTSSGQFARDGSMRALAIAAAQRSAALPDVPTAAEAGLPRFKASSWYGMLAPAGTPRPIVDKLNAAVRAALKSPEIEKSMTANGQIAIPTAPEEFREALKEEIERYKALK